MPSQLNILLDAMAPYMGSLSLLRRPAGRAGSVLAIERHRLVHKEGFFDPSSTS